MRKGIMLGIVFFVFIALAISVNAAVGDTINSVAGFLGGWQYFIVNGAIIFCILFVLQSLLMPGKADKEKGVVWIILVFVSGVASWFLSIGTGYIWMHPKIGLLFNYYVIVNTAIISLLLYFVLGLLKVKMDSGPGKTGLWVMIIIVSILFAAKLGNNWIWSISSVRGIIDFFFGAKGILTLDPATGNYRLFIFIIMGLSLSWLFTFLEVSKQTPKLNYVIAAMIASTFARGGADLNSALLAGQFIAIIIIGLQLASRTNKLIGFAVATLLIEWSISAISMKYTILGILWGGSVGKIFGSGWWGLIEIIVFIGILFLARWIILKIKSRGSTPPSSTDDQSTQTTQTASTTTNQNPQSATHAAGHAPNQAPQDQSETTP